MDNGIQLRSRPNHFAAARHLDFIGFKLFYRFKTIARAFHIKGYLCPALLGHDAHHQGLLKLMVLRAHFAALSAHADLGFFKLQGNRQWL